MADVPKPPEDNETKTIIDKLANFVARNGPEFETMTKKKQSNNPKFSFLFGGAHHQYYLWKVQSEQGVSVTTTGEPSATVTKEPHPPDMTTLVKQLHHTKVKETEDCLSISDQLEREFISAIQPVMATCSKEAIASGKGWIFSRLKTEEDCGRMAHFIMRRTLDSPNVEFIHKLHVIFFITDIVHHCPRKEILDLKQAIETVIVQIFYNVFSSDTDKIDQLANVLNIWETQKYFNESKLLMIRNILKLPPDSIPKAPPLSTPTEPVVTAESKEDTPPAPPPWITQQSMVQSTPPAPPPQAPWQQAPPPWETPPRPPPQGFIPPPWGQPPGPRPPWTTPPPSLLPPPPPPSQPTPLFSNNEATPPNNEGLSEKMESIDYNHQKLPDHPSHLSEPRQRESKFQPIDPNFHPPPNMPHPPDMPRPPGMPNPPDMPHPSFQGQMQVFDYNHRPPPAGWDRPPRPPFPPVPPPHGPHPFPPNMGPPRPPFIRPPFPPGPRPSFQPDIPPPAFPSLPYFELPAAIMMPLIPLHEDSYKPLNPSLVVLPPPQPPSDRLMKAVDEFYELPSDDKPRNVEGWQAKALLEFYDAKMKAKESFKRGGGSQRRPNRRRSRSPRRRKRRSSSSSSSSPHRRSRRRSSRSPSTDNSSSSSRSPSPHRRKGRRRSRSATPERRPVAMETTTTSSERQLSEGNVGHQMLRKMGWEGAGLGSREQGIQVPIKGGEVRNKAEQFAGVGAVNSGDPYTQFRRNKSYTYNRRPPAPPSPPPSGIIN